VRCILVPSLMVLAAKWTWWLPGWLDRALPQLHVEGDPAQLDSVGTVRAPQAADTRTGTGALALFVGVLIAWIAGTAMTAQPAVAPGVALAVAAAGGGTLAYLPRATRGGGGTLGVRLLLLLTGAAMSAAAFSLVGGLTPATRSNTAVQAAVAFLVPALLTAVTPLRRGAIPLLLGSVVAVSAMSIGGAAAVPDVIMTALLAAVVTRLAGAFGRLLGRTTQGGAVMGELGAAPSAATDAPADALGGADPPDAPADPNATLRDGEPASGGAAGGTASVLGSGAP